MKSRFTSALVTLLFVGFSLSLGSAGNAHDLWLQTNTPSVRTGEVVHAQLCLGNHGNHHHARSQNPADRSQ